MVKPVKANIDLPTPGINSKRIAKKIIKTVETLHLVKNDVNTKISKDKTEILQQEMSSTPPSIKKSEIVTNFSKRSLHNLDKNDLIKNDKKSLSTLKKQKTRSVLTKNKVPIVIKEQQKDPKRESKTLTDKFFKPEGRTQSILKTKSPNKNEKNVVKKENAKVKQIVTEKVQTCQQKKSKIPSKKQKKIEKCNLSPRSENLEEIDFKNIKHNDSFVLSAKKLGSRRGSKRPKPEVIRLYKRKEGSKLLPDGTKKLKSCLKKNPELIVNKTNASGEGKNLLDLPKKILKRSQIPRLTKEIVNTL